MAMTTSDVQSKVQVESVQCAYEGGAVPALFYRPAVAAPYPAVVDVHGGAWTSGDCRQSAEIHQSLAASGIATLALDFTMPPKAAFPQSLAEINLGIRWLKAHARDLGTEPRLIGGLGTSSGGHQLMVNVLRPRDPRYAALRLPEAPQVDASLAYVVLGWPVIDPVARFRMATERGNTRLAEAHHAYFPNNDLMSEASPQAIVQRGNATAMPPLLVLQGTSDDNLPDGIQDTFANTYRAAGGTIDVHYFDGEPHTFVTKNFGSESAKRAMGLMKDFIFRMCGRPGTSPAGNG
jgi:acetyl esterase